MRLFASSKLNDLNLNIVKRTEEASEDDEGSVQMRNIRLDED
jgi:hypothetical protein